MFVAAIQSRNCWTAIVVFFFWAAPVGAQTTYTWSGGGTDDKWSTGANWGGTPPASDLDQTLLVLSGSTQLTNTLDFNLSAKSLTFAAGAGSFVVGGSNILTLGSGGVTVTSNNDQTFNAKLALGAAQTWANNGTGTFTVGGTLDNGGFLLTVGGAGNSTSTGAISGAGGLTKSGTGTLVLSGANTYTGATTLSNGTLQAGSTAAFGNKSDVAVASGATLRLNGFSNTIGALSGSGIIENGSSAAATLAVTASFPAGTTFSGLIRDGGTGPLALVQNGGAFTLTGVHTYTGLTTVNNGLLTIGDFDTVGMIGGDIALIGTGSVTFNPGTTNNNYAGSISGAGAPFNAFEKIGSNTLILSGSSTYTGGTTLAAGTLQLAGGDDRLPIITSIGFLSNTVLDLNGRNQTLGGVSGGGGAPGPARILLGSGTLTFTDPSTGFIGAHAFDGVISGTGSIVMNRGLQGLSAANTYSGGTTINNQGTIRAINTTGSATGTGIVTVNAGGTLDGTGRIFSGNTGPIPVILNGGTVSVGGGAGVNPKRTDTLTLASGLNFDGAATLRSVVGQSGGVPSAGRVDLNISTFDRNTGGAATDVFTIRLFNDGTLDLSGSTNYTITVLTYDTLGSGLTPFTNEAHPANFAATAINFSFASDPLITLNGGELSLTFTPLPVPEPATVLGVAAGALGSAGLVRRKRRLA